MNVLLVKRKHNILVHLVPSSYKEKCRRYGKAKCGASTDFKTKIAISRLFAVIQMGLF